MKARVPLFAAFLACLGAAASAWGAGRCLGDSARYRILPKSIGKTGQAAQAPYALPCDSMIVPAGQTTRIHGATMLHFGPNPPAASKIVVKGELLIEGKSGHPAYLSGSVAATEFGFVPGIHAWDGIQVDSGAALRISHARIFNAPTALVLLGKNVVLEDCYFRGTSGLVLPDTNVLLDPRGQNLEVLDLRDGRPTVLAKPAAPPAGPGPDKKQAYAGSGTKAAWITAGGVGLLAASGIAWWALQPSPGKNPSKPTSDDGFEPLPNIPDVDDLRSR